MNHFEAYDKDKLLKSIHEYYGPSRIESILSANADFRECKHCYYVFHHDIYEPNLLDQKPESAQEEKELTRLPPTKEFKDFSHMIRIIKLSQKCKEEHKTAIAWLFNNGYNPICDYRMFDMVIWTRDQIDPIVFKLGAGLNLYEIEFIDLHTLALEFENQYI